MLLVVVVLEALAAAVEAAVLEGVVGLLSGLVSLGTHDVVVRHALHEVGGDQPSPSVHQLTCRMGRERETM